MGSKSVLILGIVFVFLLNVVAVHNYIDNYYYQSDKIIAKENDTFSSMIKNVITKFKQLKIFNEDNKTTKKEKKITPIVLPKEQDNFEKKLQSEEKEVQNEPKIEKNNSSELENLTEYKSNYFNQLNSQIQESKSEDNVSNKVEKLETKDEKPKPKKEPVIQKEKNENIKQKEQKPQKEQQTKKTKEDQEDMSEKSALIVLNLNINDPYQQDNPIIKKIAKRFDDNKVIKIKIYKYSMKIKDYLENIKSSFANYGIDVDDIKVIYKKDENKKDKIKILLSKKD